MEVFKNKNSLEQEEHLSLKRLKNIRSSNRIIPAKEKPLANFIDLMDWAVESFGCALKDKNLIKFVHNRIIIDGPFLTFCEEKAISIECLRGESIVSWKTDEEYEKFFVQGVFLIKFKNVEFLHVAEWHKGNQYEDEISFFIICSENNYQGYVDLRNEFDNWVMERDRSNLRIRVIDGEDMSYTKDFTWEDLFLPESIKFEIRSLVENFLSSKDFYLKNRIPWKRGMILYGYAGCGKTSIIRTIMSVYNFKPVTVSAGANAEVMHEAFSYAEEQSPSLLYFEDLDSLLERSVDVSSFLNLMDGISSKNGLLVVATANEIRKLKANITDRPSRFDRKFEIPLPNTEMADIYLEKWFGNLITPKKRKELAKYAVKYEFSYAYIKEVYVSAMFEALSHNRKSPTEKDIQTALNRLIKDKNLLNGNTINMDKYL